MREHPFASELAFNSDYGREIQEEIRAAHERNLEWARKWPNHCRNCEGWGGFSFTQYHDSGPGEPMMDICAAQAERTCHRCGAEDGLSSESEGPCSKCGWNYDDGMERL